MARVAFVTQPPARPSVFFLLDDEEGPPGIGEASPLPPWSRDDAETCARVLASARLARIEDDLPADIAVARALAPIEADLVAAPSARFALESALLDRMGQRRGLSVAEVLGGARAYPDVEVNGLLVADPTDTLVARADALVRRGVRALKIKLRARDDAGFGRELDALRALRRALPEPLEIRLDPNAAWPLDVARERLAALAEIAPRYVEQPVAPAELVALGACAVPWAADESLAVPGVAEAILERPVGCAAFVLKPAILGLLRARELAVRAADRELAVVVTHLFDGPVALAAASELALSLPARPLACGLDPHAGLEAWPPIATPQLARPGLITPSGRAGLGVSLAGVDIAWTR